MIEFSILSNFLSGLLTTGSVLAFVLIHLNFTVGYLVSAYIKKSRNADLGLERLSFWKRYVVYHLLALLFYSISLLAKLTGNKFDEVF